ncbi:hypothetical protein AVEN_83285-1 [Araneus ventricosus]|uniref:Uncharacterized protein n=1 Tax=Araneus ventricosus TaxID=182803 RepID=A0A4Y2TA65_ARAVE|nr:hypothetical protein AVEN_83285-1 [Araneus ventricosus]
MRSPLILMFLSLYFFCEKTRSTILVKKVLVVDDPRRSAELHQVHEPVHPQEIQGNRVLETRSCLESPSMQEYDQEWPVLQYILDRSQNT